MLACHDCRRSKLKCDRIKPCASCKLRGLEGHCYKDLDSVLNGRLPQKEKVEKEAASSSTAHSEVTSNSLAEINATLRGQP